MSMRWVSLGPLLVLAISSGACGDGVCHAERNRSNGQVTSIETAPPSADNCPNDPVLVHLYVGGSNLLLQISNHRNPPRACLAAIGVMENASIPGDHLIGHSDMCPAEWFEPAIDLAPCEALCAASGDAGADAATAASSDATTDASTDALDDATPDAPTVTDAAD